MRIAYLVNQYPSISHSFIRREILALERLGHDVLRISIRGWDEAQLGQDRSEQTRTRYVLEEGASGLLLAGLIVLFSRPAQFIRAFALMYRVSRRADRPFPIHLIYLFEACVVFQWLKAGAIEHLQAHFGTNSAEVAMLTHELGGPRWSFTVHGPEEFDKPQLIALRDKINRAAFVVAVSSFGRSQLFRYTPFKQWDKIKVVHCGIEPSFYNSAATPADTKRLICVGRLCEQKGQLLLVEATRRIVQSGQAMELVLAGDGEMRSEIEELIARYSLNKVIRITGWISSEQVRDEVLGSRSLVLPSFAEGLPVVLMEAMALRRPVISTFVAGIPELVEQGRHGWLVPAGNSDALVEAMLNCLNSSIDQIRMMGDAAQIRIHERHDVDKEAAKLAGLFEPCEKAERKSHRDCTPPTALPQDPGSV